MVTPGQCPKSGFVIACFAVNEFYSERGFFSDSPKQVDVDVCALRCEVFCEFTVGFLFGKPEALFPGESVWCFSLRFWAPFSNASPICARVSSQNMIMLLAFFCFEYTLEGVLGSLCCIHFENQPVLVSVAFDKLSVLLEYVACFCRKAFKKYVWLLELSSHNRLKDDTMKKDGKYLFTSESVGEGHPDKVADQVSDSILDAILCNDPKARVDAETLVMQGTVMVTGQITTKTYVNIPNIVRNTIKEIGLDNAKDGLDWETCGVLSLIH